MQKSLSKLVSIGAPPTKNCLNCITQRQTKSNASGIVSVATQCKFSYPQAYSLRPINPDTRLVYSGNLRLTCPYLVKAIDEWEGQGAIELINNDMKNDPELQASFSAINAFWNEVKLEQMTQSDHDLARKQLKEGYTHFVNSGIIGISKDKEHDVKCLHAVMADHLLRHNSDDTSKIINKIGFHIKQKLVQRGIHLSGNNGIYFLCICLTHCRLLAAVRYGRG